MWYLDNYVNHHIHSMFYFSLSLAQVFLPNNYSHIS